GDRLRITAQLSAADDGRNLWSERYDRTLDDVFAVQDEISRTIVSTLRTTFLADIADPTPQRYTHNLAAYSLYLKGRYCWNKRSQEGVLESIAFFKQAIDLAPGYALAYSGLSATEREPSSSSARRGACSLSYYARRYEHPLYHPRAASAMNPPWEDAYRALGLVRMQQGDYAEA